MRQTTALVPRCLSCDKLMKWHSEQTVGTQTVNVFECKACEKLSAVAVEQPSAGGMQA